MDRLPKAPPFPIGTRLRYTGTSDMAIIAPDQTRVPVLAAGLEVEITETRPGYCGTLRPVPGDWFDEEPPLDTTQDGYSVFYVDVPGAKPFGRIIWPANASEWERV